MYARNLFLRNLSSVLMLEVRDIAHPDSLFGGKSPFAYPFMPSRICRV